MNTSLYQQNSSTYDSVYETTLLENGRYMKTGHADSNVASVSYIEKYGIYFESLSLQGLPKLSARIFMRDYWSCASVTRCRSRLSEPWAHIPLQTTTATQPHRNYRPTRIFGSYTIKNIRSVLQSPVLPSASNIWRYSSVTITLSAREQAEDNTGTYFDNSYSTGMS